MAREFAKGFYNSKQWKQCRAAYIKYRQSVDGGMCETCHQKPGYIVHHKTELSPDNINNPDITLSFSNLKYDCHICHNKENPKEDNVETVRNRYTFTVEGDVIPVLPP